MIVVTNTAFFRNTFEIYPLTSSNVPFLLSIIVVVICLNVILLALLGIGRGLKLVVIILLLVAVLTAYFMDSYNIIVDANMLESVVSTDYREASDLFSFSLVGYLFFLWFLPALIIYKARLRKTGLAKAILNRLLLLTVCSLLVLGSFVLFSKHYTSLLREHKVLRAYATPSYPVYSGIKYLRSQFVNKEAKLIKIGTDASINSADQHRKLIILVVGESARADHFSLNGYARTTNPLLEQEDVVSFSNVWSCGTTTAVSVPCMFSILPRKEYARDKALQIENVLDVLSHAGVNIHWLDNNSSSKGVATRFDTRDFRKPAQNPVCDSECRDEGMLVNLQEVISSHVDGDILIVLHQMGSHGPAYYKRYPQEFEHFKPDCYTNQLEQCSEAEIINSYDNTVLYTDYFLSKAIELLKQNDKTFEAGMVYISDHGESLGESNLYLHGLPYMIAPDAQKNVPLIMWFNSKIYAHDINYPDLWLNKDKYFSHDNLFHTLLGLFGVNSAVYDSEKDILKPDLSLPQTSS